MNHKFIQRVSIDWNQIDYDSYLCSCVVLMHLKAWKSWISKRTMNYGFSTFDDVSKLSSAIRIVKGKRM
ncbi:MAG: hypothetical protein Q4C77_13645 [Eubacteriales bacterium]|nr:hypothetical protein [Eubacteriales bacterium]